MGRCIMKTTVEIADDLFHRVQKLARDEKTTFRALTEEGLRRMLEQKQDETPENKWVWDLVTFKGDLTEEFKDASWEKFRDEIYRGRGA